MPTQRRDRLDGVAIALLVLLCALWGFQQVIVKVAAAQGLPPVLQATLRSIGATVLSCLWIWWRQGGNGLARMFRRDETTGPGLLLAAVFGVEFVMLYAGLNLTSASRSVLFLYTAPFFTALGAHVFLPEERLRPMQALGLTIAFAGVAAAFMDGLLRGHGNLLGDALCGGAALLWGASNVITKASPGLRHTDASRLLLYQIGGSVPVLLLGTVLLGQAAPSPDVTLLAWLGLAYQIVVVAFASYLVWYWLLLTYPAAKVSSFTFLTPLFGILGGGLALDEPLSAALLLGLTAIALGLRLINRPASA